MTSASDGSRGSSVSRSADRAAASVRSAARKLGRAGTRIGGDFALVRRFRTPREHVEGRRRRGATSGRCREPAGARLRSVRNVLTMRSSSEWKATTTSRPLGLSTRSAAARPRASSVSSSLTKMRSAWKRARRRMDRSGRACTTRATISAKARVVRWRASRALDDGARDGSGVALLAQRGDDGGEIAFAGVRDDVGRARAVAPMRMSSGPSSRKEKPRAASSSCIDETPRSNTTPSTAASWLRRWRSKFEKRSSTRSSRPCASSTSAAPSAIALWSRSMPITRAGCRQDRARIAAAAECRVDIETAVAHGEPIDGAAAEHGNMTSRSASEILSMKNSMLRH
jgi:hypothetical protein